MKKNRFYIYVYLDQRKPGKWYYGDEVFDFQPFYVGKGTKNREIQHLCPYMLSCKTHKSSTIKSIIKDTGQLPIHYRIHENISQQDATDIEIDIIKQFGRRDLGTGILCNHTDGGDGANNLSEESKRFIGKTHQRPLYQYSLEGKFIRKWKSLAEIGDSTPMNPVSIASSIERCGTSYDYIWKYEYVGNKIDGKIRYQMPIKHKNIKQVSLETGKIINVFPNISSALKSLNASYQCRNYILYCLNGKTKSAFGYYWTTKDTIDIPKKKNARVICQYSDDGKFIREYNSMMDADRNTGVSFRKIWLCCVGKQSYAGGYQWKYKV